MGGRGTKARIEVARRLIRDGVVGRDCIVPFPQQMLPSPEDRKVVGDVTLGENVAAYVATLPEFADATLMDAPLSTGTFDDAIASVKEAALMAEEEDIGPLRFHFVSDWSQLGRLRIIWGIALRHERAAHGWQASFHRVPNFRSMSDIGLHEPPAYAKCVAKSLRRGFFAV